MGNDERTRTFYATTLEKACAVHGMSVDDHILVICGGAADREALLEQGFRHVVISNLDERIDGDTLAPFEWSFQDAEHLTFGSESFDWSIVHLGLHHCFVPHAALSEMLRVARKGVLVIENRDSQLMRLGARLGVVFDYEVEAVADHGGKFGGVANTGVPNFVYRWTEREVRKLVASAQPGYEHEIHFFYDWTVPTLRLSMSRSRLKRGLIPPLRLACAIGRRVVPRQGNNFGAIIRKHGTPKPWLRRVGDELVLDAAWVKRKFVDAPLELTEHHL